MLGLQSFFARQNMTIIFCQEQLSGIHDFIVGAVFVSGICISIAVVRPSGLKPKIQTGGKDNEKLSGKRLCPK